MTLFFLLFVNDLIFIELKFNWMIFFFVEYAKIEAIFFFSRFSLECFRLKMLISVLSNVV